MPGGRRKSRNPQKWEEMADENQISLSVPEAQLLEENSMNNRVDRNISINSNNRLLPSGCRTNSQVSHISSKEDNRQPRHKFLNKLTEERNINKEKEDCSNGPSANGNEMTVHDVLQSGRPGTFAECSICNIRLKDWESTASHIQTHRLAFLPVCISQDRNTLMKQNVTCLSCQKQFQNLTVLISHVRLTHDLTKPPYICPFCGKVFESTASLQMHIDIQDVTMRCPVCSASCNQEYLLYSHLSECLTTFHPHLESLACHVCSKRIKMNLLADHMIVHSFQSTESKVSNSSKPVYISKEEKAEGSKEKELNEEPSMFLCEVCDERYSSFHQFKTHLNKHSESKKFCPLCYLKGFSRADFVVRHLMLRCPRRNSDQFAFGSIITSIGKYHNQHFLEVLKDVQSAYPFHEGLEAWSTVAAVLDFLQSFKSFTKEELRHLPELSSAFPTGEALKNPTDIELLVWLTEFEQEMHAAAQDQTKHEDNKQEISSFKALGLPPKDLSEFERTILNENLNYVLKKDKSGRPIELNFESIDGQVTITPHNLIDDTMDMRQELMDHKPSIEYLKKTYPGISFHPEVDVPTLKRLNDEAMKLVKRNPVDEHIKNGGPVTAEDFLRLDWEAQYLRSKEQFYIRPDEKIHELSPLCKKKRDQANVDEKILMKLREEAKSLMEAVDPKTKKMRAISEADKDRLLNEAKIL